MIFTKNPSLPISTFPPLFSAKFCFFLFSVLLFPKFLLSTTYSQQAFGDLARQSTAIARVRCLGAESSFSAGEIWTETHFQVLENPKGSLGKILTIRMLGGNAAGLHSHVEGVPTFRVNEEAYLFLWNRNSEPYRVLGWSQGTFRITGDPRDGSPTVTQDSSASAYDSHTREFHRQGIKSLPLPAFQEKLRLALAQSQ